MSNLPEWLNPESSIEKTAEQLAARYWVNKTLGAAYGNGVYPDWVKAAKLPTSLGEALSSADSILGPAEQAIRKPLTELMTPKPPPVPDPNAPPPTPPPFSPGKPGDPLGSIGTAIRPAILGAGIGAGIGGIRGLFGKKKRPISGAILGGLTGGLAGGAGGYIYDQVTGHSAPQKPVAPTEGQSNAVGSALGGLGLLGVKETTKAPLPTVPEVAGAYRSVTGPSDPSLTDMATSLAGSKMTGDILPNSVMPSAGSLDPTGYLGKTNPGSVAGGAAGGAAVGGLLGYNAGRALENVPYTGLGSTKTVRESRPVYGDVLGVGGKPDPNKPPVLAGVGTFDKEVKAPGKLRGRLGTLGTGVGGLTGGFNAARNKATQLMAQSVTNAQRASDIEKATAAMPAEMPGKAEAQALIAELLQNPGARLTPEVQARTAKLLQGLNSQGAIRGR